MSWRVKAAGLSDSQQGCQVQCSVTDPSTKAEITFFFLETPAVPHG